jgi:hypothetical protein
MASKTQKTTKKTRNQTYEVTARKAWPARGWGELDVTVRLADGFWKKKVCSYRRNHHSYGMTTWFPFSRGTRDLALYSRDYTSTRIMELPSGKDIGGEDPDANGFCPVELYVPEMEVWKSQPRKDDPKEKEFFAESRECDIALVAGCIWGDDSSWKIQCFDLSQVESGIIRRDERFGYLELARGASLAETARIIWDEEAQTPVLTVAVMQHFNLKTGDLFTIEDPYDWPKLR